MAVPALVKVGCVGENECRVQRRESCPSTDDLLTFFLRDFEFSFEESVVSKDIEEVLVLRKEF